MEEISGSIYFRPIGGLEGLAPGQEVKWDVHAHDHTTVFFNGHWQAIEERKVSQDNWQVRRRITCEGPFHLLIDAGIRHSFKYFGQIVPPWMEIAIATMPAADQTAFRERYQNQRGFAWCVYSHPNGAQGVDPKERTGWEDGEQFF